MERLPPVCDLGFLMVDGHMDIFQGAFGFPIQKDAVKICNTTSSANTASPNWMWLILIDPNVNALPMYGHKAGQIL